MFCVCVCVCCSGFVCCLFVVVFGLLLVCLLGFFYLCVVLGGGGRTAVFAVGRNPAADASTWIVPNFIKLQANALPLNYVQSDLYV